MVERYQEKGEGGRKTVGVRTTVGVVFSWST